jgi:nicotinamide-nucleotide amidase
MEAALGEIARYRFDGPDLVAAVADLLERSGRRVAVAESCTGGLLAKRMTDRPGSSRWFLGGVVAYADAVKVGQLGVNAEVIARVGAVSDEVAREMAEGAARVFGAEAGVGITGIAGPDGGTPDKPVGTVCYAVAVDGVFTSERRVFAGDREAGRERSAQAALHLLHGALVARS